LEYHGRDAAARFFASIMRRRSHDLVPTRANGQPAFGAYLRPPVAGIRHGTGLFVLTLAGDRICAMTHFESSVLPWFGLPRSLPDRWASQSVRAMRARPGSGPAPFSHQWRRGGCRLDERAAIRSDGVYGCISGVRDDPS